MIRMVFCGDCSEDFLDFTKKNGASVLPSGRSKCQLCPTMGWSSPETGWLVQWLVGHELPWKWFPTQMAYDHNYLCNSKVIIWSMASNWSVTGSFKQQVGGWDQQLGSGFFLHIFASSVKSRVSTTDSGSADQGTGGRSSILALIIQFWSFTKVYLRDRSAVTYLGGMKRSCTTKRAWKWMISIMMHRPS